VSKVAIVRFDQDVAKSFKQALKLIGGIDDLNTIKHAVTIKVGVFSHKADNHTSTDVLAAIVDGFNKAPLIYVAESDNYKGTGSERLQIWSRLFNDRVIPFNLSNDAETKEVSLAGEKMSLSHILFKPDVLVSSHILRKTEYGSILKNLFGCVPTPKKMKYHQVLPVLLADIYEAVGGIDLAVLDGTYFWQKIGDNLVRMNTLLIGRDAVAVEIVGAVLAGMQPESMPILKEFIRRGLGEGDIEKIEIVGGPCESLKEEFDVAKSQKKQTRHEGAQTWSGHVHNALKNLVQEGFFELPNKRTEKEVARALAARGIQMEDKEEKIKSFLKRRVKNRILKATKTKDDWVYWAE